MNSNSLIYLADFGQLGNPKYTYFLAQQNHQKYYCHQVLVFEGIKDSFSLLLKRRRTGRNLSGKLGGPLVGLALPSSQYVRDFCCALEVVTAAMTISPGKIW